MYCYVALLSMLFWPILFSFKQFIIIIIIIIIIMIMIIMIIIIVVVILKCFNRIEVELI